ncbi:MAG: HNH endonuclease [Lachnospiraceae bacterium]|nr:HNH endonuclease [Lachnospiraceae bacterium]
MIVKLKCRVCGTEFRSERLNRLYCSDACRRQGRKEYFKSRYENNKEQLNEQSKIWRENHREYTKIKQREWNKKNPDYGTNRSRKIRGSKEHARECIVCGKAFTTWLPQKKTCSDECKEVHKKNRDKGRVRNSKKTPEEQHAQWIRRRYGSEESYQKWLAEQEALKRELEQRREQERQARKEAYENQLEVWRIARETRKEANHRKDFCIVCGKEYETYNPAQKTCSKECGKKLAHAHKHKRIPKSQLVDKDITLEALYRRDSGVCYLCGKKCDWNDKTDKSVGPAYPSIDHMIPIAKGGLHAWTNVKLAHFECNWKKSDALLPSLSSTG